MDVRSKHDLDHKVALELGMDPKLVRSVTTAFVSAMVDSISNLEVLQIETLGRFWLKFGKHSQKVAMLQRGPGKMTAMRVHRQLRVHFKKSDVFSAILRGRHGPSGKEKKVMEKFGVAEDVDQEALEKKAAKGCPVCGRTDLKREGALLFCPDHGSEPFEKQAGK